MLLPSNDDRNEKDNIMNRVARNLPSPDWDPPYPAWESTLPTDMQSVICYIGCQGDPKQGDEFRRTISEQILRRNGDCHAEFARYPDRDGTLNTVGLVYWLNQSAFEKWRAEEVEALLSNAGEKDAPGIWIENFPILRKDVETLFSSDDQAPGIAKYSRGKVNITRLHAYFGSMRDRLFSSNDSDHKSPVSQLSKKSKAVDGAGRISVATPSQLCAIRSGQDWSHCGEEQKDYYLNELEPVLRKGMEFLSNNPVETGCIACRYMTETDDTGRPKDRTFGYALFRDIADLEAWSKSHPTHLAIFRKFYEYTQAFNFEIELDLWHEVLVMPNPTTFTYVNCAPTTGLLPFFANH